MKKKYVSELVVNDFLDEVWAWYTVDDVAENSIFRSVPVGRRVPLVAEMAMCRTLYTLNDRSSLCGVCTLVPGKEPTYSNFKFRVGCEVYTLWNKLIVGDQFIEVWLPPAPQDVLDELGPVFLSRMLNKSIDEIFPITLSVKGKIVKMKNNLVETVSISGGRQRKSDIWVSG